MRATPRAVLSGVAAAWLAGCPVGCPKGNPQTIYEGPVEELPLEKIGKCTYRAKVPLQHPFPTTTVGPMKGAWFVYFEDEIAFLDWVTYEPDTATFTMKEHFCAKGFNSLRIEWHSLVRTVNE